MVLHVMRVYWTVHNIWQEWVDNVIGSRAMAFWMYIMARDFQNAHRTAEYIERDIQLMRPEIGGITAPPHPPLLPQWEAWNRRLDLMRDGARHFQEAGNRTEQAYRDYQDDRWRDITDRERNRRIREDQIPRAAAMQLPPARVPTPTPGDLHSDDPTLRPTEPTERTRDRSWIPERPGRNPRPPRECGR